jgi:hypothetical protein
MARLPYTCDDLAPTDGDCYTFTPSQRFSQAERDDLKSRNVSSLKAYNDKQKACAEAAQAGDQQRYASLKCKRRAHKVIAGGRVYGVRGQDPDFTPGSKKFPNQLARDDSYQTPISTRTQSFETRKDMKQRMERPDVLSEELTVRNITQALRELAGDASTLFLNTAILTATPPPRVLGLLSERRRQQFLAFMQGRERTFRVSESDPTSTSYSAVAYDIAFQTALNKKLIEDDLPPMAPQRTLAWQVAMELPQGQSWPRAMTDRCPKAGRYATLVSFGGKLRQRDSDSIFVFDLEPAMRRLGVAFDELRVSVGGAKGEEARVDAQKTAFGLIPFRLIREELSKHNVKWLSLQFRYGPASAPCFTELLVPVSSLQHSMSDGVRGTAKKPNYYTLTGLTVSELAAFLAGEPRAKRRGRYLRAME